MNDRFKFRAWYKPLFGEETPHYVYDVEQIYDGFTNKGHCELGWVSSFGSLLDSDEYIIEQCTGLKDKNGKLVYEGDIVIKSDISAIGYSRTRVCKVHWHNDWLSWAITTQYGDTYELSEFEPQQYEVIDNIHENADLLEVEND